MLVHPRHGSCLLSNKLWNLSKYILGIIFIIHIILRLISVYASHPVPMHMLHYNKLGHLTTQV